MYIYHNFGLCPRVGSNTYPNFCQDINNTLPGIDIFVCTILQLNLIIDKSIKHTFTAGYFSLSLFLVASISSHLISSFVMMQCNTSLVVLHNKLPKLSSGSSIVPEVGGFHQCSQLNTESNPVILNKLKIKGGSFAFVRLGQVIQGTQWPAGMGPEGLT